MRKLDHISVPLHMNERKRRALISSFPARLSLRSAAMQRELKKKKKRNTEQLSGLHCALHPRNPPQAGRRELAAGD